MTGWHWENMPPFWWFSWFPRGSSACIPWSCRPLARSILPLAFGTAEGFFFLGAALLAIGMFLSSITESQGVAAGLCFVVMLVNYFISDLASYFSASATASFGPLRF